MIASLRTTFLYVLTRKVLLKMKAIEKSLQSLYREKGNHRTGKWTYVIGGLNWDFHLSISHSFQGKESEEPLSAQRQCSSCCISYVTFGFPGIFPLWKSHICAFVPQVISVSWYSLDIRKTHAKKAQTTCICKILLTDGHKTYELSFSTCKISFTTMFQPAVNGMFIKHIQKHPQWGQWPKDSSSETKLLKEAQSA